MCDDFEELERIRLLGGLPHVDMQRRLLNAELRVAAEARATRAALARDRALAADLGQRWQAVIGEWQDNCDFRSMQAFGLAGTAQGVRGGCCWALSFDWAARRVTGDVVDGRHFHRIGRRIRAIQLVLNRVERQDDFLILVARACGVNFTPIATGEVPARGAIGSARTEMMREIVSIATEPRQRDAHGVRMLGFNDRAGRRGHEIALSLRGPLRVFDPNFGQFTFENEPKLIYFIGHLFDTCYAEMTDRWDLCIVSQGLPVRRDFDPGRYRRMRPAEAGPPEPVHEAREPVAPAGDSADAIAEAMTRALCGDPTPEDIELLRRNGELPDEYD